MVADHAELALPEVRLGVVPDSGGLLRLPRRLPEAVAREMLLTGRRMPAAEAGRWGLVNRVVPGRDLMATALALAGEVCAGAPLAVAAIEEVLATTAALDVRDGFRLHAIGRPAELCADAALRGRGRGAAGLLREARAAVARALT